MDSARIANIAGTIPDQAAVVGVSLRVRAQPALPVPPSPPGMPPVPPEPGPDVPWRPPGTPPVPPEPDPDNPLPSREEATPRAFHVASASIRQGTFLALVNRASS